MLPTRPRLPSATDNISQGANNARKGPAYVTETRLVPAPIANNCNVAAMLSVITVV